MLPEPLGHSALGPPPHRPPRYSWRVTNERRNREVKSLKQYKLCNAHTRGLGLGYKLHTSLRSLTDFCTELYSKQLPEIIHLNALRMLLQQ